MGKAVLLPARLKNKEKYHHDRWLHFVLESYAEFKLCVMLRLQINKGKARLF